MNQKEFLKQFRIHVRRVKREDMCPFFHWNTDAKQAMIEELKKHGCPFEPFSAGLDYTEGDGAFKRYWKASRYFINYHKEKNYSEVDRLCWKMIRIVEDVYR